MSTVHTLRIDGIDVAAADGQSILTVARENGIHIPTMCHLDGLSDTGACRVCIVEMLFLERNHFCAICVANNHCELQDLAEELEVDHFELPAINPVVGVDASHPLFTIDHNRCIMCLRCVRVCDEIEGAHTWDVMGAGINSRVVTDLGTPWGESTTCTSCGKCVQVCPTGALFERGRAIAEGGKERRPFLPFLKTHHRDGEP